MSASLYEGRLAKLHVAQQAGGKFEGAQVVLESADGWCRPHYPREEVLQLDAQRVVLIDGAAFHLGRAIVGHRPVQGDARVRVGGEVEPQRLVRLVDDEAAWVVGGHLAHQVPVDASSVVEY